MFRLLILLWKGFILLLSEFLPPFGEIVIYPNFLERPSWIWLISVKSFFVFVLLSVRFLLFNILYSVFNEHLWLSYLKVWWAQVDSNHRPRAYQARALTTWAMSPCKFLSVHLVFLSPLVEMMGIEPMTPCLQGRCSPSWATPPYNEVILSYFGSPNLHWLRHCRRSLKIEQQATCTLL